MTYRLVMAYAGSRTMNVGTWLLPEDEDGFDLALRDTFPGAAWRCSQPGPLGLHQVHLHGSLANAMACGGRGVQAFLHLPIGASLPSTVTLADGVPLPDGPPVAAIVQLLRSARRHDPGGTYCDHDAGYQHPEGGAYFDAGRLAVRWFEDEVGADTHQVLLRQTRAVRSVLIATTRPAQVKDQNGRRLTGYRIGPAAQAMAEATGTLLGRTGLQRFQLG
ncbi:hypothetical protein GCM10010169_34120 [Micromonospora fulviviridis]|nr:hypothetical protein GCM10010169_34120 [Micromonospora fulviviridis]